MLPSTGYFKGINCPFYDSGLCERPYCHFRHVKKETIVGDGIESENALLKLVSAAVQKVLQQTDTGSVTALPTRTTETDSITCSQVTSKVTYNPTPIAELNKINNSELEPNEEASEQKKRHIPVPYTPRKPASLSIKRPVDTNGSKLIYVAPVTYTPGSESAFLDPYKPKGSTESTEKYLPGSEAAVQEYAPKETQNSNSKVNYIPSDKNVNKKKLLEYKPTKVKSQPSSVSYQPTPRSLVPCFSSDEEEPETKKRKLSSDLNGLDDLGPEFDILDQILDEEKSEIHSNSTKKASSIECKENKKDAEINNRSKEKDSKNNCKKNEKDKVDQKSDKRDRKNKDREDRSEKSNRKEKSHDVRRSSTDKKSSHKSSSRDKIRHSSSDRSDKKTNSKNSSSSSKHSKSSSSRHSSKHSSRDKRDSKKNDNSHRKSHSHSKESKENKDKHRKKDSLNISDDENHNYDDLIENEIDELSEPDEDTIALECKRIFEEYIPTEKPETKDDHPENLDTENEEYVSSKKRVSRTVEKNIKVIQKLPIKPDFKLNAAQAMSERLAKVREFHTARSASDTTNPATVTKSDSRSSFTTPISSHSKIRIAHVPYASTMLTAKKTIPPKICSNTNNDPSTSFTVTQTVKKGSQRVAHLPSEKFIDRPGVLEPLGSKIPANIRLTYLNLMIDHCLKIYLLPTDAYARAQNEELITSKKCSTVPIYKNSAVLAISRIKKEVLECNGVKKSGIDVSGQKPVAQGTVTNAATAGSWSIENKNKRNFEDSKQFIGPNLYKNIQKWILSDEQLKENGFPRPHSNNEKGRAIIYGQNKQKPPKGFIRTCCRCKKEYTVDKKGFPVTKQDCIYHPNNKYRFRGEVKYQCCSQDGSSDGCCIASSHVYEYVDFENLKGYVKTLPPDRTMDDYGVYSLDCEMCYTTQGLDLTRVTVINSSCKVVYETLIRPLHPIIDYNTRYSGITEEQMAQVKTTLLEVQATLLTMFNSKTILIGHSLESDFKALKLIHDTVIDTSVLFPHKMGPPYKRALRNLSSEHLKKIIQNSVDGHDSAEDATVCMELLMYKVREDLKTR